MRRKYFSIALIVLLAAIQLWFVNLTLSFQSRGIALTHEDSTWKVDYYKVAPGLLRTGDIVLSINGTPTDDYPSVNRWKSIEQGRYVEIIRDGTPMKIELEEKPSSLTYDLMPFFGEVISFLVVLFIWRNMRHSPSATLLAWVFTTMGLIFMSLNASIRGDSLGKLMIAVLVALLPVLFLHFLSTFFQEKGGTRMSAKTIKTLYGICAVMLVCSLTFFLKFPWVASVYTVVKLCTVLMFIIGLLINLYYLANMHFRNRKQNSHLSTIIKTVWISLCLSFSPLILFSLLPDLLLGHDWINALYSGWFVLFFPLSFTYLIASKQLYDVETLLRRALITTVLAIAPSVIIVLLNRLVFHQPLSGNQIILSFTITLALVSYVLYALEYFSTKLEKVMFPRKYTLQHSLKKISKSLESITSFRGLKDFILRDIINSLQVYGAAIVFKYNGSWEIISDGMINEQEVKQILEKDRPEHPLYTCIEMTRNEEYTSYILLTRKKSNTILGLEDHQWLNLIVSYLSVSLENVHLIRKLTSKLEQLASQLPNQSDARDFIWFRKLTFELQEKERVRIANDLHDTTMQDLFFLKKKLSSLLNKHDLRPEEQEQMNSIIDYVDIINTNLRQSCFELHPHLLHEIGLVETVHKLVEQESPISSFDIEFYATSTDLIESRDIETKRHLFRIVQELMNNAKKHSEATKVMLGLAVMNQDTLYLTYEDDGIGFEQAGTAVKNAPSSGFGMEQLRSRVLYLNGNLNIDTRSGSGVSIAITIPIKEVRSA